MNKSFIFLADGFEEIEALAPLDIMRRAGMPVSTVSITSSREVTGAHGVVVKTDMTFDEADFEGAEWTVLPGGMPGAANLAAFGPLTTLLTERHKRGEKIAAICASPALVLAPLGILDGREATCYPGMATDSPSILWNEKKPVVATDHIVTGHGPGASISFGLTIAAISTGAPHAAQIAEAMMVAPR